MASPPVGKIQRISSSSPSWIEPRVTFRRLTSAGDSPPCSGGGEVEHGQLAAEEVQVLLDERREVLREDELLPVELLRDDLPHLPEGNQAQQEREDQQQDCGHDADERHHAANRVRAPHGVAPSSGPNPREKSPAR